MKDLIKALRRNDRKGQQHLRSRGGYHTKRGYTRKTKHKGDARYER